MLFPFTGNQCWPSPISWVAAGSSFILSNHRSVSLICWKATALIIRGSLVNTDTSFPLVKWIERWKENFCWGFRFKVLIFKRISLWKNNKYVGIFGPSTKVSLSTHVSNPRRFVRKVGSILMLQSLENIYHHSTFPKVVSIFIYYCTQKEKITHC